LAKADSAAGLAYLLRLLNRDAGFELTPVICSDSQVEACAFHALRSPCGRAVPDGSIAYLSRASPV